MWILVKMSLTKDGNNCQIEICSKNQDSAFGRIGIQIIDTVLGLIGKNIG